MNHRGEQALQPLRDVLLSQAKADKLFGEMKAKARRVVEDEPRPARQLSGEQLTRLLRRLDAAQTEQERRHCLREYMRGFYGYGELIKTFLPQGRPASRGGDSLVCQ
jgi:hypothetical protein